MGFTPSLLKKLMTERSSFWCMLQAGLPYLHYYFAVVLHSCITLPPVGHSSYHEYHYCQITRQTSCVLDFYCTFKLFIWISLVFLSIMHGQTHIKALLISQVPWGTIFWWVLADVSMHTGIVLFRFNVCQ
jgi:hypothetical protein